MPALASNKTVQKILTSAELLFAQQGYDGTSIRQIVRHSGVNLAAINYHYGGKEGLYVEVVRRIIQPINRIRMARLGEAEQHALGGLVPLATLFALLADPLFQLGTDQAEGGPQPGRLLGRSLLEPRPFMEQLAAEELAPVLARFGQAVRRHVPALTPEDFLWRFGFVVGALHHTLATLHRMKDLTRGICRNHDHAGARARFIEFATDAFTSRGGPISLQDI